MYALQLPEGPISPGVAPDSSKRTHRRRKRKLYNHGMSEHNVSWKKPHQLKVKSGGEINAACDGKNAWDAALKLHVTWVLDISIINWDAQKLESQ
jgi:hypothetical protein